MFKGKCYIYARQSSPNATDGDLSISIEQQEKACRDEAEKRDLKVMGVYEDRNLSGRLYPSGFEAMEQADVVLKQWIASTTKRLESRDGLGKLLKEATQGSYIVIYDMTRLHRSLNGSYLMNCIMQTLVSKGVKIISCREGERDFSSFNDSLVASLVSQVSSEQLIIQVQKSKEAINRQIENGLHFPGLWKTYGYTYVRKGVWEVDEYEASVVRRIYEECLNGKTKAEITRIVNKEYTLRVQMMCATTVRNILHNPAYIGWHKTASGEMKKMKMLEGKEIIPYETWKRVQELDAPVKKGRKDKKRWWPLSGYVFCGICGKQMTGGSATIRSGGSYRYYRCAHAEMTGGEKHNVAIQYDEFSESRCGLLPAIYPLMHFRLFEMVKPDEKDKNTDEMKETDMKLQSLKAKEQKLTAMFMADRIGEDAYYAAMDEVSRARREAEAKQREMIESERARGSKSMGDIFDRARDGNMSHVEFEEAVKLTFKRIELYETYAMIHLTFGDVKLPRKTIDRGNTLPKSKVIFEQGEDGLFRMTLMYYFGEYDLDRLDEGRMKTLLESEYGKICFYDFG